MAFSVTIQEAWQLFETQGRKCALSGVPLSFSSPKSASLDRKDSKLGYTLNNVQWLHKEINRMKGVLGDSEFVAWCKLVSSKWVS
jgi:hypothetical protein